MQVEVQPGWSSSGVDHHIEADGYMVLNEVVHTVYLDGEVIEPTTTRYYTVSRIEDRSPEAIHLFS